MNSEYGWHDRTSAEIRTGRSVSAFELDRYRFKLLADIAGLLGVRSLLSIISWKIVWDRLL
jgi:hypothetical protein